MSFKINDKVTWVGKIDWELRSFHGEEYSTHRGSSYNSYLIRDEKTVLMDTVWVPYSKEFVANLKNEIDLKQIDYIKSIVIEKDKQIQSKDEQISNLTRLLENSQILLKHEQEKNQLLLESSEVKKKNFWSRFRKQ
jgi:flavorubredoxin